MQITISGYDTPQELRAACAAIEYLLDNPAEGLRPIDPPVLADPTDPVGDTPPPPAVASDDTPPPPAVASTTTAGDDDDDGGDSPPPIGDLDSAGMPWDERIHTKQRTTIKDGTWKLTRGVDPELVKRVRAEYAASAAEPPAPASAAEPPAPGGAIKWVDVLGKVMDAKKSGSINQEQLERACAELGVGTFAALVGHPDKYEMFLMTAGL